MSYFKPYSVYIFILLVWFLSTCAQKTDKNNITQNTDSTQIEELQIPDPIDFDLDRIIERGSIKALMDNTSATYFLYKGEPMGFEYELADRFAKFLGVDLEVEIVKDFEEILIKLNNGDGDIICHNLTITRDRKKFVNFSNYQYLVRQVLVQRKPEGWENLKAHELENSLIRNQVDLIGRKVHVRKNSSFAARLRNLSDELGGNIIIEEQLGDIDTESIIKMVVDNEIEFTIADEDIALLNATYYPDLDVKTPVSFPQQIAWACRLNAPALLDTVNLWLGKIKATPDHNYIYQKYFLASKEYLQRANSDYSSIAGGKISPYDDLIRKYAGKYDKDWRMLAAIIFQESRFDPKAISWAGAVGLMQIMPRTGREYGVINLTNPEQNLIAGTSHLYWLYDYWKKEITNEDELIKFTLGSYNVGQNHIRDAMKLAEKYGRDPKKWDDNVAYYLQLKSKPKYYKDPVVNFGYCRGEEPVNYVNHIHYHYNQYKLFIDR
ncbi:transglycosylase SLT domain-containing protein [Bacteroidota bacterium]